MKKPMKYYISYSYHENILDTWLKNLRSYTKLTHEFGNENVICPIIDRHSHVIGYELDPLEIGIYASNEDKYAETCIDIIKSYLSEPKLICTKCRSLYTKSYNDKIHSYNSILFGNRNHDNYTCCMCGGIMTYEEFVYDSGITILMHESAWNTEKNAWNSLKCQKEYECAIDNRIRILDIVAFLDKKIANFRKGRNIHD